MNETTPIKTVAAQPDQRRGGLESILHGTGTAVGAAGVLALLICLFVAAHGNTFDWSLATFGVASSVGGVLWMLLLWFAAEVLRILKHQSQMSYSGRISRAETAQEVEAKQIARYAPAAKEQ